MTIPLCFLLYNNFHAFRPKKLFFFGTRIHKNYEQNQSVHPKKKKKNLENINYENNELNIERWIELKASATGRIKTIFAKN